MSANHTPGPWVETAADEWATGSGEHAQWGRFDISAGSGDFTAPGYYRIGSVGNVNDAAENKANARLIAAAPCLLTALQKALEHCIWPSSSISAAEAEAKAAIAKATGEDA